MAKAVFMASHLSWWAVSRVGLGAVERGARRRGKNSHATIA